MKFLILIGFLLISIVANAQPGRIDKTFGNQNYVRTDFYGRYDHLVDLAFQSNGKILACGNSSLDQPGDHNDFALARYNEDGSLDKSFGVSGKSLYHFGSRVYSCLTMMLQDDGKIILAGNDIKDDEYNHGQIILVRFDSNGTVDNTFGNDGKIETNFPVRIQSTSFVLQNDGKILISGYMAKDPNSGAYNNIIIRMNQDGAFDNTFGNSGIFITDSTFIIDAITIQDDKIIAVGSSCVGSSCLASHITLYRFNTNGIPDISFGNLGKVYTEYIGGFHYSVKVLKDEKILVSSTSIGKIETNYYSDSLILLKFMPNGIIDSSFGRSGTSLKKITTESILPFLCILPNGKILARGPYLVCFNENGIVDTTFGNSGTALFNEDGPMIFQSGKIIAPILESYGWDFLIQRLDSNGTIDNTFSSYSGIVNSKSVNNDVANNVTISAFNHIVLVGYSDPIDSGYLTAIGFDNNGLPDHSFSASGSLRLSRNVILSALAIGNNYDFLFGGYYYNPVDFTVNFALLYEDSLRTIDFGYGQNICNSVLAQKDGKFISSGYAYTGRNYDFALARYDLVNGIPDSSFGTNGKVTTDIGVNQDLAYASALQSDGKIILSGTTYNDKQWQFALVRYESDGSVDKSFGSSGIVTSALHDSDDEVKSMAMQSDGKIVVAGFTHNDKNYNFALARYNTNGSLDSSFGKFGFVETSIGTGNAQANGVVIEKDGKIIAAGYASNGNDDDFALACYNPDGSLDKNFGTNGITTTDFGFGDDHINGVALQSDGAIVAAGYAFNGKDKDYAVARYLPDLSLGVIDKKTEKNVMTIYPNPIHNMATIGYELSKSQAVSMKLYDVMGKEAARFLDHEIRGEGKNQEQITLPNNLPAGSYYLSIETEQGKMTVKIIKSEN